MKEIRGTSHIRGVLLSFIIFHSRIALFFSIFSYVWSGNDISAKTVIHYDFFSTIIFMTIEIDRIYHLGWKFYHTFSNNNLELKRT